jgi:hypothetical protein
MSVLFHLLRDGYFPKELPPVFNTIGFSHLMSSQSAALPPKFKYNKKKQLIAKMSEHNIARVGVIRRKLSIPNPIAYFLLCSKIDRNWPALKKTLSISKLSKSEPIISAPNSIRALSPKHLPSELTLMRAQCRLRSRYLLQTDIKDFVRV